MLLANCAKSDAAQQVIAQGKGDDDHGDQETKAPAAIADHSIPPVPSMVAMPGGAVRALSLVSIKAKAYSFQAKIRQKTVVAAMPVIAWGRTILKKACIRV